MKIESSTAIFGGLGIAAIVAAVFFLVREVRGAGQDLSESITKGVLSGVEESVGNIGANVQQSFSDFGSGISQFLESEAVKQRVSDKRRNTL